MIVVVGLGGNALARRGEPLDIEVQRRNVARAAAPLAVVAREHQVVITHGNGPQVGLLAEQSEAARGLAPYPLDVLDAESEGMIGYLIAQELGHHLQPDGIATLLTQVVVDPGDAAFDHPAKPIGPMLDPSEADQLAARHGWTIGPDGSGIRRLVPSPEPVGIVELRAIEALLAAGFVVICAGGGGIPVVPVAPAGYRGVEAVVDKDLSAALLATVLRADALLLLTDVEAVYADFGTAAATPIRRIEPDELRRLDLPAGSMGPKAEAACRIADRGGRAAIGRLDDAEALLRGDAGTQVLGPLSPPIGA